MYIMGDACYCENKSTGSLERVNLSQLQSQSQIGAQSEFRAPEIAQSSQLQQPANENSIKDFAIRLFNKGKSLMEKHINPQLAGKLEIVAKKIYQKSPEIIDRYEYQFNKPPSFRQLLSMVRGMVRDTQGSGMVSDIMKTMMTNQKSHPNWGGKTKRARRKTPRSRRRRHRHRRTNKRK